MSDSVVLYTDDERVRHAVEKAGYEPLDHTDDFERDRLVVLDAGADPKVVSFLRSLSGGMRRSLLVVVVGDAHTTGDREQAWRQSADLVVHPDDYGRIGELILELAREKADLYTRVAQVAQGLGDF